MATCSISGVVPEEPVVSLKSGHLFEKRLIVKHIEACGLCPVTQMPLSLDDLLPVKTSAPVVRPRPPTGTSFPQLLQMLQNEWDAMALETFTMRQKMNALKQELAHAAYEQDAAKRVIARLIAERDSALEQLKNVDANVARAVESAYKSAPGAAAGSATGEAKTAPAAASGDSMDDGGKTKGIPQDVIKRMEAGQQRVGGGVRTSTVKQRQAMVRSDAQMKELVASEAQKLVENASATAFALGGLTGAESTIGSVALVGTASGAVQAYSVLNGKVKLVNQYQFGAGAVTAIATHVGTPGAAVVGTANGTVFSVSYDNGAAVASGDASAELQIGRVSAMQLSADVAAKAGGVVSVALHPAGDVAVASFENGTWAVFDAESARAVAVVPPATGAGTTRVALHPDGNLVGVISSGSNKLQIYDTATQSLLCTIDVCPEDPSAGISAVVFSENGLNCYTFDTTGAVKLWQLRKPDQPPKATAKLPISGGSRFGSLVVDASGSYVIVTVDNTCYIYTAKALAEVTSKSASSSGVCFAAIGGSDAHQTIVVSPSHIEVFTC